MKRQKEYEKRQKELEESRKSNIEQDLGIVVKNPIIGRSKSEEDDSEVLEEDQIIIDAIHQDSDAPSNFPSIDGIPDAKTVYEAKKRREQMRRDGTKAKTEDPSFIPLSNQEKVVHSRLIREDDYDMSDEDENNEFYSSKKLLITEEERRRQEQEELLRIEGES